MTLHRRAFMNSALALSSLSITPTLLSGPDESVPTSESPTPPINGEILDFWTNRVRQPSLRLRQGIRTKGADTKQPDDAAFLFFDQAANRFVLPTHVDTTGMTESGDVDLQVAVKRFRPSDAHRAKLAQFQSGSLRIDVSQVDKLPGIPEALAWSAITALLAGRSGTMPLAEKVKFDIGASGNTFQDLRLPGGKGFWSWNFFAKSRTGFWGRLLAFLGAAGKEVIPLLTLPVVSITALKAIDQLLGYVQAEGDTTWLFKSIETPLYCTKAAKTHMPDGALPLHDGTYVVASEDNVSKFADLVEMNGLIVPKNTPDLQVFDAAKDVLKDVTYVTVAVKATASPKPA